MNVDLVAEYHRQRWPHVPLPILAVKLAEETGEVCAEIYDDWADGSADRRADVLVEAGDVLCVLVAIVDRLGADWGSFVAESCGKFVGQYGPLVADS